MLDELEKRSTEEERFEMPFAGREEMAKRGDTIAAVLSVTVIPTTDPPLVVVGAASFDDLNVQAIFSGGITGQRYLIKILIQTAQGYTLENDGYLTVQDMAA